MISRQYIELAVRALNTVLLLALVALVAELAFNRPTLARDYGRSYEDQARILMVNHPDPIAVKNNADPLRVSVEEPVTVYVEGGYVTCR